MPLPDKDEVLRDLGPILPRLDEVLRGGWQQFQISRLGRPWGKRTRANVVYEETIDLARRRIPEAYEMQINEQHIFVIDQRYALRFKKLDGSLASSNVRTRQNRQFRNQEGLDGLPPFFNLEAGYVLNRLETDIVSTHLVCPSGLRSHAWQISLDADALAARSADILPFPTDPRGPQPDSIVRFRKKPKPTDSDRRDDSDESGV
jgi:hypothetical protein